MNIRKVTSTKSFKDFSSLFFSNIFQKLLGLVREPVIAFFFGSSLLYANYLLLRTGADFFSQFTVGNALKANLLPKFTKIYDSYQKVSLKKVFSFSNRTMIFLFVISQIIQSSIIIYLDTDYHYLLIISVLLSFSICFNFFNTVYLTIMQAQGKFFKYSVATTLNSFIVAVFIYPFTLLWGIFGLVISRLFGILTLTFSYILPMNKERDGYEVELSRKDLNIPTLILGNFANIIIISSRFVSGSDGSNNITYFTYSIFILNVLLTAVIGNVSTLLLRKISIKKNNKFMYYSLGISVFIGSLLVLFLHYFSFDLIELVYQRGKFGISDVENTATYLYQLSYSFILIFIATTLFQPFFTLKDSDTKKVRNFMSTIFLLVIFGGIFVLSFISIDVKMRSLILIYSSSFVSVLLSIYSYIVYLKNEK
ncbi:MAG: hypothetical protein ACKVG7_01920 [Flavobacteriales bacterium]